MAFRAATGIGLWMWATFAVIVPSCAETGQGDVEGLTEERAILRIQSLGGHVRPWPDRDSDTCSVDLHNSAATDEEIALILAVEGVKYVALGKDVTDAGLLLLANLPDLETVNLGFAPSISPAGVAAFLNAVPPHPLEIETSQFPDRALTPFGVYRSLHAGSGPHLDRATHWYLPEYETTPWTDSADGTLSLRVLVLPDPRPRNDRRYVVFELSNNTDEDLLLDYPSARGVANPLRIIGNQRDNQRREWNYYAPSIGAGHNPPQCILLRSNQRLRIALNLEPMLGCSNLDWTVRVIYESIEYVQPGLPPAGELPSPSCESSAPEAKENAHHWRIESNAVTFARR